MSSRNDQSAEMLVLSSEELEQVSGGILKKIEPGDEFLTLYEHYLKSMEGVPIEPIDNPMGLNWDVR